MATHKLSSDDQLMLEYIEEESNSLVLEIKSKIENDGYLNAAGSEIINLEVVSLKIISMAMIKVLALAVEKLNHHNLAAAYLQLVPLHTELIKLYLIKEMLRESKK